MLITVKDGASEEETRALVEDLKYSGIVESMEGILENSRQEINTLLVHILPRPVFNLLASLIAYLSMVILLIRKKRHALAVDYLCGAEKRSCVADLIGSGCLISFIPMLIVALMIIVVPEMQWRGQMAYTSSILTFDMLWVPVLCFIITLIISAAAALISLGKRSPVGYLRGLE